MLSQGTIFSITVLIRAEFYLQKGAMIQILKTPLKLKNIKNSALIRGNF
jgi:hypothetical protein